MFTLIIIMETIIQLKFSILSNILFLKKKVLVVV